MSSIPTHSVDICNVQSDIESIASSISDLSYSISNLKDDIPEMPATESIHEHLEDAMNYLSQAEDQAGWCEADISTDIMLVDKGDILYMQRDDGSYEIHVVTEAPEENDLTRRNALEDWGDCIPEIFVKNIKTKEAQEWEVTDASIMRNYMYISKAEIEQYREKYAVMNAYLVYEEEMLEVAAAPTGPANQGEEAA